MAISSCYLLPEMPHGLEALTELALDMRWTWNHATDLLWTRLDPVLWEQTHNPWLILQSISGAHLHALAGDQEFLRQLDQATRQHREALEKEAWFERQEGLDQLGGIAYFCMEFGLTEVLPLYSGGLGILAGDCLKTASDLGVPVTGVGLLYQQGYFRQVLDADGRQREFFTYNDPIQMPVMPVRDPAGEWLRVEIPLPGRDLRLQVWQAVIGRRRLYLLDSNDPRNSPADRGITGELYGGNQETRLQQEMVLGIGGWRVLQRLGLQPEVCHLNEGHAAFAILERAHAFAEQRGCSFELALTATRAGNLFTTHTPVAAGFDQFPPALIRRYLGPYCEAIGLGLERLLELGRNHPADPQVNFNMAWLAVHGAGAVNGVSRLHGEVSRAILQPLFPHWPREEVPIGYVTNGVHVPSWDSAETDRFWTDACGKQRWLGDLEMTAEIIRDLPDETFWSLRTTGRQQLIDYVRQHQRRQWAEAGQQLLDTSNLLDPNALTLCFSRRFTSYKRPNLLLADPPRLARLLNDPHRPVQLCIAGKAHPLDEPGKALIQAWIRFIEEYRLHHKVVFLSDYDIRVAEQLVQGADVWINTPRRPWEASGTSGMKVLVNGGLNLSELDGWWAEAWRSEVGWSLGDGLEHGDDPAWDAREAGCLYRILEEEVIPCFYRRDAARIPREWVARIRASMAELTPEFSANRMLREYTQHFYSELARAYRERDSGDLRLARELGAWRSQIDSHWPHIRFGDFDVQELAEGRRFNVDVYLDDLPMEHVRVELYAEGLNGAPEIHPMQAGEPLPGAVNGYLYHCTLQSERPADHYTPRIRPYHPAARLPIEAAEILWQR